jgi:hypothetical protein
MTEKKKEVKKTVAKKAPAKMQANTRAQASVKKEKVYPAINIANTYGISSFDFYMIKEQNNINDDSLLTIKQFQKYYQKILEGR